MKDLSNSMELYRKTLDRCAGMVSDEQAQAILANVTKKAQAKNSAKSKPREKTYRRIVPITVAACVGLAVIITGVQFSQHGGLPGLSPVVDESLLTSSGDRAEPGTLPPAEDESSLASSSDRSEPGTPSSVVPPAWNESSPVSSGDKSEPETPSSVAPPVSNGKYHWNKVQSGGSLMMYKDPNAVARKVTFSEFCDILGYNPTPAYIPAGYENTSREEYTFYVNPDGSWADYYSFYTLGYTKGQDKISIRISPVEVYANNDVPLNNQALQKSTFNGFEATLMKNNLTEGEIKAYKEVGSNPIDLSAVFQIRGVNYYAFTRGDVPAEEFLKVLQSLY